MEIYLTPSNLRRDCRSKENQMDELTIYDFNIPQRMFFNARVVIFTATNGIQKILKNHSGQPVYSVKPGTLMNYERNTIFVILELGNIVNCAY